MQVDIGGNGAHLASETGNLVRQHARCRRLNRIIPIVVVVAQGVGEVKNSHLTDVGGVFGNVEMRWFNTTLCD